MDLSKVIIASIFMIIGAVVFVVLVPTIFKAISPVATNSTYIAQFGSTITLLEILPLILVALFIAVIVKGGFSEK